MLENLKPDADAVDCANVRINGLVYKYNKCLAARAEQS